NAPVGAWYVLYPTTGGSRHRLISERPFGVCAFAFLHSPFQPLSPGTNRFERAALRRSVSNEGGEFHLARYQALCFRLSFEHQCPGVPPDVAEHEFHRTRESDRVSFAPAPLCLRRLGGPPHIQLRVQQQESAFSRALRVKAQWAVVAISEGDLHVPSAKQAGRLCLGDGNGA